jgi:hypothetical protein
MRPRGGTGISGATPLRAAAALVVGLLTACAPQPSAKPLGWGPLLPGMGADPAHAARHAGSAANRRAAKRHATQADAGTPSVERVAEAKPESSAKPPAVPGAPAEGPKSKATTVAFVGDYTGEDVSTYRIETMPDRTEKDPNAKLKVTSSSDSALAFELVDSSNGKEICTLKGTLGDAGVTIAKGQKCFEENGEEASAAATVLSGTASITDSRLVFDLDMSFAMEIAGRKLGGSLAYHFDGKRK